MIFAVFYVCFFERQFSGVLIQIINEITDSAVRKRIRLLEILGDKRMD
jgi:hypothetical protein